MSHKMFISLMIWAVGWFGLYFGVLECLAAFPWAWNALRGIIPGLPPKCPWYTVSRTSWHIEDAWWPFQFVFMAGLTVLMIHIFQGGLIKLAAVAPRKIAQTFKKGSSS